MSVQDEERAERQQKVDLDLALRVVNEQSLLMQRAMDGDPDGKNLKVTLDYATEMLRELRSNTLSPKAYYELYMTILDGLRHLEDYFSTLQRQGASIVNIYEQVQSCGNVVPRLYLLCCVGGVYIQSLEAPAKDVLRDLVEMLKGVQHPTRGLFLRNYLTQVSKNKLPDTGSPYEGTGGNAQDAYNFVLLNFAETNRLWVRLQSAGGKNKKKREAERQDLRILVGANLVRLSQLEGLGVAEYKSNVLPNILEEVVNCKDTIAQTYLMDCIINVFPDDFHLATLEEFLTACTQLKEKVNVREILESMMERLGTFADNGTPIPADVPAFKLFNDCVTTIIEERANMALVDALQLQTSLANFSMKCYSSRMDFISHCLETCASLITKEETFLANVKELAKEGARSSDETTLQIENLLLTPLSTLALRVLEIPAYSKLMSYLPWGNWSEVSATLTKSVIKAGTSLSEIEQVEQLLQAVTPLLRDREGAPARVDEDGRDLPLSTEFVEEQQLLAKVVHLMQHEDTDQLLRIYVNARTHFTEGGRLRIQFTLPPLVIGALTLTRRVRAREEENAKNPSEDGAPQYSSRKILLYILEIITALGEAGFAEVAMQLYLLAAKAADDCGLKAIAYEFFKEAPILYEEEIVDSKKQVRCLTAMIGTLVTCVNFEEEHYDILTTKLWQYSNKLLKKPDQCRMVTLCSHLFWPPALPDGTHRFTEQQPVYAKSLECMKRAIKIIRENNPNPALFVEILDRYIYHFENDNPMFDSKFLSGLIQFINEQLGSDLGASSNPDVENFYRNSLAYIKLKQTSTGTGDLAERFKQIEV